MVKKNIVRKSVFSKGDEVFEVRLGATNSPQEVAFVLDKFFRVRSVKLKRVM